MCGLVDVDSLRIQNVFVGRFIKINHFYLGGGFKCVLEDSSDSLEDSIVTSLG